MNKQIDYFANTRAQIIEMLGEEAGMKLISSAVYSSNIGSNDYLNNYYQPFSPIGNLTSSQVATLLITTYRGQLTVRFYRFPSSIHRSRKIVQNNLHDR